MLAFPAIPLAQLDVLVEPRLFFGVFAGLVLALAFQVVLTSLSVAAGASALGAVGGDDDHASHDASDDEDSTGVFEAVRKANHAYGVWALVTGSVALFFAAWLAVETSAVGAPLVGAVLGLVIWGLFLLAATALEAKVASMLVGSLVRAAGEGLRAVKDGISSVVSRSPERRVADLAADVTASVRDELLEDERVDDLKEELRAWVAKLEPQPFDPKELRKELETLLGRTEVEATVGDAGWAGEGKVGVTGSIKTRPGPSKSTVQKVAHGVSAAATKAAEAGRRAQEEPRPEKPQGQKLVDGVLRAAGMSAEEAEDVRRRVEAWLRETGRDELEPEGIERDLERLVSSPRAGAASIRRRLAQVDRETVKAVLSSRDDMDEQSAERVVARVERAVGALRSRFGGDENGAETVRDDGDVEVGRMGADYAYAESHEDDESGGLGDRARGIARGAENRVRGFLDELGKPELRYESIRRDFRRLTDDPKAASKSLLGRLKAIDRQTIEAAIATRPDLDEEDAARLIDHLERARDETIARVERMQQRVEERLHAAREAAKCRADEARRTAATAAWWAVGAAAASGVAAALGGLLATATDAGFGL